MSFTLKTRGDFDAFFLLNPLPDDQKEFIEELFTRKSVELQNQKIISQQDLYKGDKEIYKNRFNGNSGMANAFFKMAFPDEEDYKEKVLLYLTNKNC